MLRCCEAIVLFGLDIRETAVAKMSLMLICRSARGLTLIHLPFHSLRLLVLAMPIAGSKGISYD